MASRSLSFFLLGLLVGAVSTTLVLVLWQRSEAGPASGIVLRMGHSLDQTHPIHGAMTFMSQRLAELSNGELEMRVFPNGQLGSQPQALEQVQRGALAMVNISAAGVESFVPEMAVFGLPYLFRDEDHYWQVLGGEVGEEMLKLSEPAGSIGLCYFDAGARSFYTASQPVLGPEDVRGQKIRVQESRMAMDMISTFGGSPTPIPWGELYTALQQGMVDGAENNPPSFVSSRHYEVARHFSLNEHTRVPDMLMFSVDIWDNLEPRVQEWVRQAATEAMEHQRELWRRETAAALERLDAEGVEIYEPNREAFARASQSMHERFEGTPVGEFAERIKAVR